MLPENVTHFSDFDSFDRTVICDDFDMAAGGAGRHTALLAETQCVQYCDQTRGGGEH